MPDQFRRGCFPPTISAIWQQWLPDLHPLTLQVRPLRPPQAGQTGVWLFLFRGVDSFFPY
jgi:hypothetical protein